MVRSSIALFLAGAGLAGSLTGCSVGSEPGNDGKGAPSLQSPPPAGQTAPQPDEGGEGGEGGEG